MANLSNLTLPSSHTQYTMIYEKQTKLGMLRALTVHSVHLNIEKPFTRGQNTQK